MKLGAEPKKIAILVGLLLVAAFVLWNNSREEDYPQQQKANTPAPAKPAVPNISRTPVPEVARNNATAPNANRRTTAKVEQDFRPSLKPKKPEDRPDPMTVDPTLKLTTLAKLQNVKLEGGMRSLFDFSQAPPPKQPDPPKILPKKGGAAPVVAQAEPPKPPGPPPAPVKPPPPAITLKFYGFIGGAAAPKRRAFFLDGDDILVGGEGELLKKRYKIVRIGLSSVEVEDTQFQNKQTLPLEEPQQT